MRGRNRCGVDDGARGTHRRPFRGTLRGMRETDRGDDPSKVAMDTSGASSSAQPPRIDAETFERLVRESIPQSARLPWRVLEVGHGRARLVMQFDARHVRAGGTVSGPALVALADTTLYLVTLSVVGLEPLAVTSDLSIRFLRRAPPGPIVAEGRALRARGRLIVGEVTMSREGEDEPIAHATGTYVVPTHRRER